jgi:DNA replication protein DnaC
MPNLDRLNFQAPPHNPKKFDHQQHGIDWDEGHTCHSCGTLTEYADRPYNRMCAHCKTLWPIRCMGKACETLLRPDIEHGGCEPYPYCQSCEQDRLAEGSDLMLKEIPSSTLTNAIDGWRKTGHRDEAEKEAKFWLRHDLGKGFGNITGLYFYGDVGTGKTTIAARCAAKAISSRLATSFMWIKEFDLMMATKATSYEGRDAMRKLFERLQTTGLVVIDEMFAVSEAMTDNARIMIGQALARRFEDRLPTIITSNHEPSWSVFYDDRVNSRFNGMFKVMKLAGPDLRQHFGGNGLDQDNN